MYGYLTVVNSVVLLLASFCVIWYGKTRWKKRGLPSGPLPLPLLGNALNIIWREEPFIYFHQLGKQYGGVFTFYLGSKPTVVVTDTDLGMEGLIDRSEDFGSRPPNQTLGSTTDGGKDIAFAPFDDNFRLIKKHTSAVLRKFTSCDMIENRTNWCWSQMAKEWDRMDDAFNPRDSMSRFSISVALAALTGQQLQIDDVTVREIHDSMYEVERMVMKGLSGELLPFLHHFNSDNRKFTELDTQLLRKFQSVLEKLNIEDAKDCKPISVAQYLVAFLRETDDPAVRQCITVERCAHVLSDYMAGSNSSVTAALVWLIYYMAKYPDVKRKVLIEITATLGFKRMPALSDRPRMTYTQAVMNEALRLRPIMPLALRHYTTNDTTLGKWNIPKNTDVMFSIYSYHLDPARWNDAHEFKPERWLDDNAELRRKPRYFMPFGGGVRICPGEAVARAVVFLAFIAIVQRYDLHFPLGQTYPDRCLSNTFISTAMARDFKICISKRTTAVDFHLQ